MFSARNSFREAKRFIPIVRTFKQVQDICEQSSKQPFEYVELNLRGTGGEKHIDSLLKVIQQFSRASSYCQEKVKDEAPEFYFAQDIRYLLATDLEMVHTYQSLLKTKAATEEGSEKYKSICAECLEALYHLEIENSNVWQCIQKDLLKHPQSEQYLRFLSRLELNTTKNPFRMDRLHLKKAEFEVVILEGLVSIVEQIIFQYIGITLEKHWMSNEIDDIPLTELNWSIIKALIKIGEPTERLLEKLVNIMYHVWRFSPQEICKDAIEIVDYLAYQTSYESFQRWINLIHQRGSDFVSESKQSSVPLLQAIAMALVFEQHVNRLTASFANFKFKYLVENNIVDFRQPLLFFISKGENSIRLTCQSDSSLTSLPVARYHNSFTKYLVVQLKDEEKKSFSQSVLDKLMLILERNAPLPYPDEPSTEKDIQVEFSRLLSPIQHDTIALNSMLSLFARRRILFTFLPTSYQAHYVRNILEEVTKQKDFSDEKNVEFYGKQFGPLLNLKLPSSAMNYSTRWDIVITIFSLGPDISPFLKHLFIHQAVPRITDYSRDVVNKQLATSDPKPVRTFSDIVTAFGKTVKDNQLRKLWIPANRAGDFVHDLFLWGLRASTEQIHDILSFLTEENKNINLYESVSGSTYYNGFLHAWIASVPASLSDKSDYWQQHVEVMKWLISKPNILLPNPKIPDQQNDRKYLLQAFDLVGLTQLWTIFYSKNESWDHFKDDRAVMYKTFCIKAAEEKGDWKKLSEIGIYPQDPSIRIMDGSGSSQILGKYLLAIRPEVGIKWFNHMMEKMRPHKAIWAQFKKVAETDSHTLELINKFETQKTIPSSPKMEDAY